MQITNEEIISKSLLSQITKVSVDETLDFSRKLLTSYTKKAYEGLKLHNIDVEQELKMVMSSTIIQELETHFFDSIIQNNNIKKININLNKNFNYFGDSISDLIEQLETIILNFDNRDDLVMVASPMIVTLFQALERVVFNPTIVGSFKGPNNSIFVGNWIIKDNVKGDDIKVVIYSTLFYTAENLSEQIIILERNKSETIVHPTLISDKNTKMNLEDMQNMFDDNVDGINLYANYKFILHLNSIAVVEVLM